MTTEQRDALLTDLRIIQLELRGISPKVSIYPKMKAREAEILKKLEGIATPKKLIKKTTKKDKILVKRPALV